MTPTTFRPTEEVISSILNMICPDCGGPMGGRSEEFRCQGRCRTDWRMVWEGHAMQDPVLCASVDASATAVETHRSRGPNGHRLSSPRRSPRRHSCQGRVLRSYEPAQVREQGTSEPWWAASARDVASQNASR